MQLTPSQQQAIRSVDQSTAIIAGAGSGKTEVLTGRLLYLLKEKGLNLSQILCVTFTEKAALEMKHRIAKNVPPEIKKELPWAAIGTFHGICLGILKEQAPLLGLPPLFSVWDEATARLEIHRACRQTLLTALQEKEEAALLLVEALEFRFCLLLLEELMGFRWHWERLKKSEIRNPKSETEEHLLAATKTLYSQVLKQCDDKKTQRQSLDFQDLEIFTLNLLKENQAARQSYQSRFQHILVDEAQDINDCQQELLELLWNPSKNRLCIVGDPKQSIYRFRGANVEGFHALVRKIEQAGGQTILLQENFRARPGILKVINHTFRTLMDPALYAELKPTRAATADPPVAILPIDGETKGNAEQRRKAEAEALARTIASEVAAGRAGYSDFALLFQSLTEVRHYEAAFRRHNIPCRLSGGRGFLSAQEVLDCLFVLKILETPNDRLAAVGLMRSPFLGRSDIQITELCLNNPDNFLQAIGQQPDAAWLQQLAEAKENLSAAEILEKAIHATGFDLLLDRLDPSGGKWANVEQLITLIRELETGEQMSTADILTYFETLKKRNAPIAAAPAVDTSLPVCQLMTVHAAKGLEFPIVILPDLFRAPRQETSRYLFSRSEGLGFYLRADDTPFSDFVASETVQRLKEKEDREELAERKRLLYVAMTRAREKLIVPIHSNVSAQASWHKWIQEALDTEGGPFAKCSPLPTLGPSALAASPFQGVSESVPPPAKVPLVPPPEATRYLTVTDLEKKLETGSVRGGIHFRRARGVWGDGAHSRAEQGWGSDPPNNIDVGNVVHAVMKHLHQTAQISLEQLVKKEAWNLNLALSPEHEAEITRLLRDFLDSPIAPPRDRGVHELPFRLRVGTVAITGQIDYFYETEGGLVICDFKTDAQFRPEKYQLQMDTYALALSERQRVERLARPVLETQLLYLRLNKKHLEKWDAERQKRIEAKLKELTGKGDPLPA